VDSAVNAISERAHGAPCSPSFSFVLPSFCLAVLSARDVNSPYGYYREGAEKNSSFRWSDDVLGTPGIETGVIPAGSIFDIGKRICADRCTFTVTI